MFANVRMYYTSCSSKIYSISLLHEHTIPMLNCKKLPMLHIKNPENLIAYFSMEIGIDPQISTYSGGLGILAGDTLRSFADLKVPAVAVTLLYETGYFTQHIDDDGNQIEKYETWDIKQHLQEVPIDLAVRIGNQDVRLTVWKYTITGLQKHRVPVFFLDSNHPSNPPEFRKLTQRLYPTNKTYRLMQEIILGIGGLEVLEKLNYEPTVYHLNEGHSAFLTVGLLKRAYRDEVKDPIKHVREHCVFTTHTPVPAGHDRFSQTLVAEHFQDVQVLETIPDVYEKDQLNMTRLALEMSGRVNGVAKKHAEVSRKMFPDHIIQSITNGIHHTFWLSPPFQELFNEMIPGWYEDPFQLYKVISIPKKRIEAAHLENKRSLIKYIKDKTSREFDENVFTIGYARRITRYKRPDLLFYELDKLNKIAEQYKLQLVFAGKAHPEDKVGKSLIREITNIHPKLHQNIQLVFLENYTIDVAKHIIPGVDLWLNTPKRPLEASGTSGMKASLNGVPNFSVLDGWWLEGAIEGVTGWGIGPKPKLNDEQAIYCIDCDDSADLYEKLGNVIAPMYYNDRQSYNMIRRNAIALHGSYFNSHRMVQQYILQSYL